MKNIEIKKYVIPNLPYVMMFWIFSKIAESYRLSAGADVVTKAMAAISDLGTAITQNPLPSFHPRDLLFGIAGAAAVRAAVYFKGKNAKKYRHGVEYGSARWGNAKDIEPFIDPKFDNNILLTQTERIMIGRNKIPKYNINKNVLIIGGSGSGKTRFHVKPNLMQMNSSYVVTDPKGTVVLECGKMLQRGGYEIKILNTIDFKQSMRYNPFRYLRCENDILKLVNCIMENTKGEDSKGGEDFWSKAEALYYQALIAYIWYEAPENEKNFNTLLEMLNASEVREEDETFKNAVDMMFDRLEQRDPEHIALKHYRAYHSGATKTLQSIQITLLSRLGKFNLESIERLSTTNSDDLGLLTAPEERTVIFAVTPVADSSFNFFVSLLYGQLFEILYDYGNKHGKLKVPMHILMDEFANVTLPKDFELRLATFRKYGISASIILQDMSQLKALYEKQWQAMMNNADLLLYLGGNESGTHEYLSKLLGKQTIRTNTFGQSKGRSGSFSKNEQQMGRELMTPDEIRMLDNKLALLFVRGERPILDGKYDFKRHPHIRETTYGGAAPYVHNELTHVAASFEPVMDMTQEQVMALPEAKPVWFTFIDDNESK